MPSASLDPAAENEFATSPEGIEFVTHAANDWARAAIADGDAADAAVEAAGRSITFYTVVPEEAAEE